MKKIIWLRNLLIISLLFLTLTRCGQIQDPTTPAVGTFSNVYNVTLKTACIQCHQSGGNATVVNGVKLDFSTQATAYQTLTTSTVHGSTCVGTCASVKIVVPSSVNTSYLAAVLFSQYNVPNFAGTSCTPYNVHLTDQNLSATEQTSIITWIQNGALNN